MSEKKLPSSEAQELELAIKHLNQGEYEVAAGKLEKVLLSSPNNELAHVKLGHAYLQQKNFPQATRHFNNTLAINPGNTEAIFGLGFYYFEQGDIDAAIAKFTQVISLEPDNPHPHFGLGLCHLQKRQFDRATQRFKEVLKINPGHRQAQNHLGLCYSGLGQVYLENKQLDLAQEAFKNAIKINAEMGSAHQGLGSIYLERGLNSLAEAEFVRVLQTDEESVYLRQMLGYVYKRQGKHDQAVAEFIKATDLYLAKESNNKSSANFRKDRIHDKDNRPAIKIIRMPSFCSKGEIHSTELNTSLFPPLALGQIVAHLRGNGVAIDQDDLNIKIHYDNYYSRVAEERIDTSTFFREELICQYILGKENWDLDSLMECVERKTNFSEYSIILLSLPVIFSNSSCLMFTLSLARFIKKKYNPILILGGARQTLNLLGKYDCKDIDLIIDGEGEPALLKLLLSLKIITDQTGRPGCQMNEGGKIVATEVRPPLKPDFNGLPIDKYRYKGIISFCGVESRQILDEFSKSATLLLPFRLIKGCPYECIFCASASTKTIFVLEPQQAAVYLKELQEEYSPDGYFFLDDTVNISRQYINDLCDEILKLKTGILWSDCARADNLDRGTIFKMRQAGCIRLIFGMETASRSLLKYVDKRIGLRGLENALRWSDEAGIWTGLEVICGLPHERDNDIDETVEFLNRNKEYINTLYFNQFDLRDGSLLLENAGAFGIENIIELNQYANEEFTNFHKYGYDETGGLRWQDKIQQVTSSYKRIATSIDWDKHLPLYEFEHFLFFLYKKFNDKQKICAIFAKAAEEKNGLLKKLLLSSREAAVC